MTCIKLFSIVIKNYFVRSRSQSSENKRLRSHLLIKTDIALHSNRKCVAFLSHCHPLNSVFENDFTRAGKDGKWKLATLLPEGMALVLSKGCKPVETLSVNVAKWVGTAGKILTSPSLTIQSKMGCSMAPWKYLTWRFLKEKARKPMASAP